MTPPGNAEVFMANAGPMFNVKLLLTERCVGLVESVTVTCTGKDPAAVGMPEITPAAAASVSPLGKPVALHVYGVVPPAAVRVTEYPLLTTPPGSDWVVIASPAPMLSV